MMDEELRLCFNIDVTEDEFYQNHEVNIYFYTSFGLFVFGNILCTLFFQVNCMPFQRSDATCTESGQREQINMITAFIDGSNIYGSDDRRADGLREGFNKNKKK